jgi:hypothetical protein
MTAPGGFVAQLRAEADRGAQWWTIKWSAVALLGVVWGVYLLTASSSSAKGNNTLWGLGILLAGLAGLLYVLRSDRHMRAPAGHPLDRELAAFGDAIATARDIDEDFAGKPFVPRRVNVGRRWVCYAGRGQVTIRRLDALVWAYTIRLTHKLNAIIPYRVSNHLMLWGRDGTGVAITTSKASLEKSLEELRSSAGWMLFGFSETLNQSWSADRSDFIAEVDARRRQYAERAGKA